MRFVAVKSEAKQASAMIFKVRDLLIRQKTQMINALRGHMMEFGILAATGPAYVQELIERLEDPTSDLPDVARLTCRPLIGILKALKEKIKLIDLEIARRAKTDDVAKRLMTIPGIGPVIATAIDAVAPPHGSFNKGA